MDDLSENLPHIYAEGIDYSDTSINEDTSYPDVLRYVLAELDILAEEFENADPEDSILHLYRGDSRENLESYGSVEFDTLEPTGDLQKDFPLYFTTSEEEARDHARRKPTDERYLLKLEVPFDNLDRIRDMTPVEVARNFESIELSEETMYHNQANKMRDSLEWISTSVPQEWIEEIEELE